jgi:hypothetical protein
MKYTAEIGGHSWQQGPKAQFRTIRECRQWAEEYGTTADWCVITDRKGRVVGRHHRKTSGNALTWFPVAP